jgi:hypothetical protein
LLRRWRWSTLRRLLRALVETTSMPGVHPVLEPIVKELLHALEPSSHAIAMANASNE